MTSPLNHKINKLLGQGTAFDCRAQKPTSLPELMRVQKLPEAPNAHVSPCRSRRCGNWDLKLHDHLIPISTYPASFSSIFFLVLIVLLTPGRISLEETHIKSKYLGTYGATIWYLRSQEVRRSITVWIDDLTARDKISSDVFEQKKNFFLDFQTFRWFTERFIMSLDHPVCELVPGRDKQYSLEFYRPSGSRKNVFFGQTRYILSVVMNDSGIRWFLASCSSVEGKG
ncbi:hypothetical protein V8F33_003623 [Rhypophila sp. PSN 637]